MADKTLTQRGPGDPSRGAVERSDMDAKGAGWAIAALAGTVAIVCLGAAVLLLLLGTMREPAPAKPVAPAAPRLQTNERADRAAIEARAQARLAGKDGGVPIKQAMRETAAAGWDAR